MVFTFFSFLRVAAHSGVRSVSGFLSAVNLARVVGVAACVVPAVQAADIEFKPVADGVYAFIGETGPRTYANDGLNANLGLVVTPDGALLIDSGASYQGARKVAEAVARVSKVPVRWVINTGNQDQRWLGNGYFKEKGAEVIAHSSGRDYLQNNGIQMVNRLRPLLKDKMQGTSPTLPTRWLDADKSALVLGGVAVEVIHQGGGHTPGDSIVWLPQSGVAFAGDLVYVERMLGMNPSSRTKPWLASFEALENLSPKVIVPGHGNPTQLERARKDTRDLLLALRHHMLKAVEELQDMDTAIKSFDPTPFRYLQHADIWLPQLANRTYLDVEME